MLSKRLHDALNAQINAELWSAYLYLSMSMDAENKGLKGVANWFFVQFREEQDHARILMNYINSRDAKVVLKPIEEVRTEWTSPLDMFKDTLEHEKVVTSMITTWQPSLPKIRISHRRTCSCGSSTSRSRRRSRHAT